MSQFSDMLKIYVDESCYNIKQISEMCEIDRTLLQKILKGDRKPSEKFVEKVSGVLMLTNTQKEALEEAFKIVSVGEEVYYRRQKVGEIINKFYSMKNNSEILADFNISLDIDNIPEISVYHDRHSLLKNLQLLFSYDVAKGSDINIIMQPSEDLVNLLRVCFCDNNNSQINHIFCFNKNSGISTTREYNLDIFEIIYRVAARCGGYIPYYYYENVDSHINSSSIMPCLIFTDNFVLCADEKLENGIIYKLKKIRDFYSRIFENKKSKCKKLLTSAKEPLEVYDFWHNVGNLSMSISYCPCVFVAVSVELIKKYIVFPQEYVQPISDLIMSNKEKLLNNNVRYLFFEEGLKYFMDTGLLFEVPNSYYKPLSIEDRKNILREIIEITEKDIWEYRIIKPEVIDANSNLAINVMSNQSLKFALSDKTFFYVSVNEQSLINAFSDYLGCFSNSENIYSKEITLMIMRKYL